MCYKCHSCIKRFSDPYLFICTTLTSSSPPSTHCQHCQHTINIPSKHHQHTIKTPSNDQDNINTPSTHHYTINIPSTYHQHTIIPSTYHQHTINIPSTHHQHTINIPSTLLRRYTHHTKVRGNATRGWSFKSRTFQQCQKHCCLTCLGWHFETTVDLWVLMETSPGKQDMQMSLSHRWTDIQSRQTASSLTDWLTDW